MLSNLVVRLVPPRSSKFREKLHSEKSGSLQHLKPSRRKSDSVRQAKRLPQPFSTQSLKFCPRQTA